MIRQLGHTYGSPEVEGQGALHDEDAQTAYVKMLEERVALLEQELERSSRNTDEMKASIDEMIALQQISEVVSTTVEPEKIAETLRTLSMQVAPSKECNIFLLNKERNKLAPFIQSGHAQFDELVNQQMEEGILDWVIAEKKPVIIPDLSQYGLMHFVIVPLLVRNEGMGVFVLHTSKSQEEFTNHDLQLLSILANSAAVGVENWRTYNELSRAQEDIKTSQAQMLQSSKLAAIGEMAGAVIHEIKNPVQILLGQMELYKRGIQPETWLETMTMQVDRLVKITRRLLDFSRAVPDEFPLELVQINGALKEVAELVRHQFKSGKIELVVELEENVPQIYGNTLYLQQVFLNLIMNARDAMPSGGRLLIHTEYVNGFVRIHFSDTGEGIDPENLPKVFQAFFTTKEKGKGTGLGLSVAHRIIKQHEGSITVESQIGIGTTFSIAIPVRRTV
ncbi:MAG: ATP-binding protein [Acidobacteriota bacterium]